MNRQAETPQNPYDAETIRATARVLYESAPASTFESVALEIGVSPRTIKRWSAGDTDGPWRKAGSPKITARAHHIADRITEAVHAVPVDDEAAKRSAVDAQRIEEAATGRADVLARHRSEWGVVRGLAAEAVRSRDSAKARLAVDVGRALELCQRGERRAFGLDLETVPVGHQVVVIERT